MKDKKAEEEGRRIARQLGVRYTGPQYRKNDEFIAHLFTDVEVTGTTFAAKTLQEAIANLAEKRRVFGAVR